MSAQAAAQVDRIVALVAELTRREAEGDGAATTAELARHFDVTPAQIVDDIVTLTRASDEPGVEWLLSVSVALEADRVQIASRGPFRRPVRLTALELAAVQVGLAGEGGDGPRLSADLAALLTREADAPPVLADRVAAAPAADGEARVVALAHAAIDGRRVLAIRYAGGADRAGTNRLIEPHQVAASDGRLYVVAWCRAAGAWRHFRADRVLDASLDRGSFTWRDDFTPLRTPEDVFRTEDEPDEVVVRFAPSIARWLAERHPDAHHEPDGSVTVTYRVADPAWLVRTVLQYGADAEVVGPEAYRQLMRESLERSA